MGGSRRGPKLEGEVLAARMAGDLEPVVSFDQMLMDEPVAPAAAGLEPELSRATAEAEVEAVLGGPPALDDEGLHLLRSHVARHGVPAHDWRGWI